MTFHLSVCVCVEGVGSVNTEVTLFAQGHFEDGTDTWISVDATLHLSGDTNLRALSCLTPFLSPVAPEQTSEPKAKSHHEILIFYSPGHVNGNWP